MHATYVEVHEFPVMRVKADMKGKGPSAAFELLESKLPTLKGRKFYGSFRDTPNGEEYYACVVLVDTDDPAEMQLETGVIPGGMYVRRKIPDWEKAIRNGQLPHLFRELMQAYAGDIDPTRPQLEFYRGQDELQLLVPVRGSPTNAHQDIV
jgi:hypothetical protein